MSSVPTYYTMLERSKNEYIFKFDDLQKVYRFINEFLPQIPPNLDVLNTIRQLDDINAMTKLAQNQGPTWFGTVDSSLIDANPQTYLFNNQLPNLLSKIQSKITKVNVAGIDQSKKLKFTEQEVGIFSFDLCSLGLVKQFEYYSPILKKNVSPNLVISEKNKNGELFFYHIHIPEIKEHVVVPDFRGYYSPVLKRTVPRDELIERDINGEIVFYYPYQPEIKKHLVERRQKQINGIPQFSSTFKKSFARIHQEKNNIPRLDLIVYLGFNSRVDAEKEMKYNCISTIALAEQLSILNIPYKILFCDTTEGDIGNKFIYNYVVLKNEGEPLDKNKMAIALSDGRFYRLSLFKLIASLFMAIKYPDAIDSSLGLPLNDRQKIKDNYLYLLENSNDINDRESAKYPDTKIVLGGVLTEQDAIDQFNDVIKKIQA